eukprot:5689533-Amphidinium_carterae.1
MLDRALLGHEEILKCPSPTKFCERNQRMQPLLAWLSLTRETNCQCHLQKCYGGELVSCGEVKQSSKDECHYFGSNISTAAKTHKYTKAYDLIWDR